MEAPDELTRAGLLARGHPGPARGAARRRRSLRRPPGGLRAGGWRDPGRGSSTPATGTSRPLDRAGVAVHASGAGPTPSTSPPPCATSTPPWSLPARSTTSTSTAAASTLRKRQPVLGDFDPGRYRTERRWAVAEDGTEVPLSLVFRPDLVGDPGPTRPAPCLLYGYGSYEVSIDPTFSSLRLSLLDRGFVFAIAHVRGGGEMGRSLVRAGQAHGQAQHLHRLRGLCPDPDRRGVDRPRAAGGPWGQRRWAAHGGGGQSGSRTVPRHRGRGAVRRLSDHHPRRHPCP